MSGIIPQRARHHAGSNSQLSAVPSQRSRGVSEVSDFTMQPPPLQRYFEPCAATASMFLYAQGASVVCCHHDTLTIERRFARHSHEVQLLAVDNHSESGAGRLVVSYDAGKNVIVWDLMTGDEISRLASLDHHITAAAWMRSGNVAFGKSIRTLCPLPVMPMLYFFSFFLFAFLRSLIAGGGCVRDMTSDYSH